MAALDLRSLVCPRTYDGAIGRRHSAPQRSFHAIATRSQHRRDDNDAILLPGQQRSCCQPSASLPLFRSCFRPCPRPCPSPVYRPADSTPPRRLMQPTMMFLPSPPDSQFSSVTASLRPFFSLPVIRTRHFMQSIHTTPTHTHHKPHLRSHDADAPILSHSDAAPYSVSSCLDSTPFLEPAIPPPSAMDRTSTRMQTRVCSLFSGPSPPVDSVARETVLRTWASALAAVNSAAA